MFGFESKCARTSKAMMLTLGVMDEASAWVFGLEGRRPRRPLRLSVRTTEKDAEKRRGTCLCCSCTHNSKINSCINFNLPFFFFTTGTIILWLKVSFLALVSQVCQYKPFISQWKPWGSVIASPSLTIPTTRHFWKRQNWQRFLLLLSTGQSLLARHTYFAFFCTVRCPKLNTMQEKFKIF